MSSRTTASKTCAATVVSIALAGAGMGNAHAGTSGSLALTSDYLFRGISQNNQEPALQGGIEYAADSGFYVGTWGSNVSWLSDLSIDGRRSPTAWNSTSTAAIAASSATAVGFDVGALYYWYPGDYPVRLQQPRHRRALLRHQRRRVLRQVLLRAHRSVRLRRFGRQRLSRRRGELGVRARPGRSTSTAASSGSRTTRTSSTSTGSSASPSPSKAASPSRWPTPTPMPTRRSTPIRYGNYLGDDTVVLTLTKTF